MATRPQAADAPVENTSQMEIDAKLLSTTHPMMLALLLLPAAAAEARSASLLLLYRFS